MSVLAAIKEAPVKWSVIAIVACLLIWPMFSYALGPASHAAFPGVIVTVAAAFVCSYAFIMSVRKPWWRKALLFLFVLGALRISVEEVLRYIYFGVQR